MKARPEPYAIKPKVEAELERLVELGVLEPVATSEWATAIDLVIKTDRAVRLFEDFELMVIPNLCVEQFPLPLTEDLFSGLARKSKFMKIDLFQVYMQWGWLKIHNSC